MNASAHNLTPEHAGSDNRLTASDGRPMAAWSANEACAALELADACLDRERTAIFHERERIAADLNQHAVRQLFAAGLALEGAISRLGDHPVAPRLIAVTEDLDSVITRIRTTIFSMQQATGPAESPRTD